MSPELHVHISTCTTINEVWIALQTIYANINESRKIQVQDQLEDFHYRNCKNMDEFLVKFNDLRSQLKGLGVKLEEIRCMNIIL